MCVIDFRVAGTIDSERSQPNMFPHAMLSYSSGSSRIPAFKIRWCPPCKKFHAPSTCSEQRLCLRQASILLAAGLGQSPMEELVCQATYTTSLQSHGKSVVPQGQRERSQDSIICSDTMH